jgi:WhiB family redox-sensing transcriptional regulator
MPVTTAAGRPGRARALSTERAKDWRDFAACADEDPELFAPETGHTEEQRAQAFEQAHRALQVCATCPVIASCRQWAADNGVTSGVWGGVWLDYQLAEQRRAAEERKRQHDMERRFAEGQRMNAYQREATELALAAGTEVIRARLAGQEVEEIAAWAGASVPAVRRALLILLPPPGDKRVEVSAVERLLRHGDRLTVLIARGRTNCEIAKALRCQPLTVAQARTVLKHRAAARSTQHVQVSAAA